MTTLLQTTQWINIGLAGGIVAAALATAGKVTRTTRCEVRLGVFGIFAGAAAYIAGGIWEFGEWTMTALLGGLLIFLVANARAPVVIAKARWSSGLAWSITAIVLGVLGVTFAANAGEEKLVPARTECQAIGRAVYEAAVRRLRGEPIGQASADVKRAEISPALRPRLERELERLNLEKRPPADSAIGAYKRCQGV